jgi:hypothetical protein
MSSVIRQVCWNRRSGTAVLTPGPSERRLCPLPTCLRSTAIATLQHELTSRVPGRIPSECFFLTGTSKSRGV